MLQSAKKDAQLHHATCNFKKTPGHMYHLYERSSGSTYFSMLSPQVDQSINKDQIRIAGCEWFNGVTVSTWDFESQDPSSNLG